MIWFCLQRRIEGWHNAFQMQFSVLLRPSPPPSQLPGGESTLLSGAQKGDGGFKLLELESEKCSIGSTVYLKVKTLRILPVFSSQGLYLLHLKSELHVCDPYLHWPGVSSVKDSARISL